MEEELELNEEEKLETIKELFGKLIVSRKSKVDIQLDLMDVEGKLKQDVAEAKDYKNKDGSVNLKEVKMSLLKDAIAIQKLNEINKLQKKYDLLEEYLTDLGNQKYNDGIIDTYLNKLSSMEDNKIDIDEIKDSYTGLLAKDEIKAIDKISKIVEKEYLLTEKAKIDEANGKKTKTKDASKSLDIDALVLELAKKLNIKIK